MSDRPAFGGPTFFIQAPSGIWGEFESPNGEDFQPGKTYNIFECRFLGVLYREATVPDQALKKTDYETWKKLMKEHTAILGRDDVRMSLCPADKPGGIPSFVTLVPLDENGL